MAPRWDEVVRVCSYLVRALEGESSTPRYLKGEVIKSCLKVTVELFAEY